MKKFKKIVLSTLVVLTFIIYSVKERGATGIQITPESSSTGSSSNKSNPTQPTSGSPSNISPTTQSTPTYKDGTYTGDQADALYGIVQVQVTIQDGKITNVVFLQHPDQQQNSVFINQQAMPILSQEAIKAQSANVSGASGATDTSQAFVESLTAALDKAQVQS